MEDLYYRCPTGVYFVKGAMQKAGQIIHNEGYHRLVLIYGGSSLKAHGNYDILVKSLKDSKIDFMEKGGVLPNPDISFIRDALSDVRNYKPDLILAVGGGSVIDTAKNLASAYFYKGDSLDFNKKLAKPVKSLPVGVILTISAAGSEMSDSCVISDYTTGFKGGFNDIHNRPAFTIEDPLLTYEVPTFQTACGLVDIISHSFERYFSPSEEHELADKLALAVIKDIVEISPVVLKDPSNEAGRRSMMIASSVSHNGWTSFGKKMRFPCHGVEHIMSGKNSSLAHGLGLRFLLADFMEINKDSLKEKINVFGHEVFGLSSSDPQKTIEAFRAYLDSLPLPKTMEEVGFSTEEKKEFLSKLKV